ncbi:MAG: hypothetical protein RBR21_13270 [Bacteroidales bacterium]|nr:hypothetical protein [Bacteroidales bacterium]
MTTATTINLFPKPETRQEKYLTGPSTMTTTTTFYLFPSPETRQEKYLTGLFNNDNNDNLLSLPLSRDPSGEIPDGSLQQRHQRQPFISSPLQRPVRRNT